MTSDDLGRIYRDGEVIFHEGDTGNQMYVIQEGSVCVTRSTDHGEVHIATLGPGDIFGEIALFDEGRRSATVTAHPDARILSVDKEKFLKSICHDPSLAFNLLKVMSGRIRNLDDEYIKLKTRIMEIMEWGMDLEETCRVILEEAKSAVDADNGSVMIADSKQGTFRIMAAFGEDHRDKTILLLEEGIAGHALSSGQTELVKDAAVHPRYKSGGLVLKSVICAPLGTGERKFGVINLSTSSADKVFTPDDLRHVQSVTTYASVAMENAIGLEEMTWAAHDMLKGFQMRGSGEGDEG